VDTKILEKQIAKLEQTLERLRESKKTGSARIAQLEGERKTYVLAARSGDGAAQTRLDAIDADLEIARRDERDDGAAIEEVLHALKSPNAELASAQRESRRAELREKIKARLVGAGERRIINLLAEMNQVIGGLLASDMIIADDLEAFDKRLAPEARKLGLSPVRVHAQHVQQIVRIDLLEALSNSYGSALDALNHVDTRIQ